MPTEPFREVTQQYTNTLSTTQKKSNLTNILLQHITVSNEHDFTKLEEWLADIETSADLTNESRAKLVDGCFSYCLYNIIMNFLNNRTNIWIWRQAFTSLQHGFLRSEENDVLYNFETPKCVWENVVSYNVLTLYCFLF